MNDKKRIPRNCIYFDKCDKICYVSGLCKHFKIKEDKDENDNPK